jgi:ADP-ribosylglycohydrolase
VTSFIDLTEEDELPAYAGILASAEQRIGYRRLSIQDHDVPESPRRMTEILDAIDAELAADRCVYVHCRAGIGRTGTVIGCYLMRRGLAGEGALDRLQTLWRHCARSRSWPTAPETDSQIEFVRGWRESRSVATGALTRTARFEGALVGLAVGDAIGTLFSTQVCNATTLGAHLKGITTSLDPGADASMTQCVVESLLAVGRHDAADQMQRYQQWVRAADTSKLALSADFKRAVATWQWSRKANAGSHDPKNLDAHTVARTLAVALFMLRDPPAAVDMAAEVSRTTLQSPIVLDACRFWAALMIDALSGAEKAVLLSGGGPAIRQLRIRTLKPQINAILEGRWHTLVDGEANAVSLIAAAMAEFAGTHSYREAVSRAVASSRAAPTCGALLGALSGAHYGIGAIPDEWRSKLSGEAHLSLLARQLSA